MYVYWIKRSSMTDPHNQGYVGVTTKSLNERFREHAKYTKRRSVVAKAIELYDDIVIVELYEGSEEQCLHIEESFRPDTGIGWNIAKGGGLPTPMNEFKAAKISKTLKGRSRSSAAVEKQRQSMIGKKWFYDPVNMVSRTFFPEEKPDGWLPGKKPKKSL